MEAEQVSITRIEGDYWYVLCEGESGVVLDGRLEETRVRELVEKAETWEHFISFVASEVWALTYTGKSGDEGED